MNKNHPTDPTLPRGAPRAPVKETTSDPMEPLADRAALERQQKLARTQRDSGGQPAHEMDDVTAPAHHPIPAAQPVDEDHRADDAETNDEQGGPDPKSGDGHPDAPHSDADLDEANHDAPTLPRLAVDQDYTDGEDELIIEVELDDEGPDNALDDDDDDSDVDLNGSRGTNFADEEDPTDELGGFGQDVLARIGQDEDVDTQAEPQVHVAVRRGAVQEIDVDIPVPVVRAALKLIRLLSPPVQEAIVNELASTGLLNGHSAGAAARWRDEDVVDEQIIASLFDVQIDIEVDGREVSITCAR